MNHISQNIAYCFAYFILEYRNDNNSRLHYLSWIQLINAPFEKRVSSGLIIFSERSIRNDIRILRSDILGFNVSIQFENGIYSYSEPNFSIYGRPIKEKELLLEIQDLLVEKFDFLIHTNHEKIYDKSR